MTTHTLSVETQGKTHRLEVLHGANLRKALLENGFSPYALLAQTFNCGGRGLCATCGIWLKFSDSPVSPNTSLSDELPNSSLSGIEPEPVHWHDKAAQRFRYPRLSCQIKITSDLTVRIIDDKKMWGKRKPKAKPR